MTPFEYLSVLISVIVGLGLSHLLTTVARLVQARHQVRFHLPTALWIATLFVAQVQIWWVTYQARTGTEWNFFAFLFLLAIPVIGYLLAYLVAPAIEGDQIDLRANYNGNRTWFFGLVCTAFLISFARDLFGNGIPLDVNTAFRGMFILLAVAAMRVEREWYHVVNGFVAFGLFCSYVFVEFVQLQ